MNDWDRFLIWLNPDPNLAASEYKTIRQKLVIYFIKRNCDNAEDLADQTIERVAQRLFKFGDELPSEPLRFCYGFAKNIHKEHIRQQLSTQGNVPIELLTDLHNPARALSGTGIHHHQRRSLGAQGSLNSAAIAEELEIIEKCLHNCLQQLDVRKRETFIKYYLVEPDTKVNIRESLARQMGITLNALRLQMLRLKEDLRACISACRQREARV